MDFPASLPDSFWLSVVSELDPASVLNLSQSCRTMRQKIPELLAGLAESELERELDCLSLSENGGYYEIEPYVEDIPESVSFYKAFHPSCLSG
jgi:hypothetical protein